MPRLHSFPTRRSSDLPHVHRKAAVRRKESSRARIALEHARTAGGACGPLPGRRLVRIAHVFSRARLRSEEHTSELQSQSNLVCRLLLEKKKEHPAEAH